MSRASSASRPAPPDEAALRAALLETLGAAGAAGASAANLRLGGKTGAVLARRAVLASLVEHGSVAQLGAGKTVRYFAAGHLPTATTVAEKLLALGGEAPPLSGTPPTLWKLFDLRHKLAPFERPLLDATLERLGSGRQVVLLRCGRSQFIAFAAPLRAWLAGSVPVTSAPIAPPRDDEALFDAYERLVRESGGFPDVKISNLRAAVGAKDTLAPTVLALWREGIATLSRGDWSLADDCARADAVELDGQRYLLVRFER